MRGRKLAWGMVGLVVLAAARGEAAVVTDNNLSATTLGGLTNAPNQVSVGFTAPRTTRIAVGADVTMTKSGYNVAPYCVDAISSNSTAVNTGVLAGTFVNWNPPPASYSIHHTLVASSGTAQPASRFYYNLGVGRSDVGIGAYKFVATNITLYVPAGKDAGLIAVSRGTCGPNLVPNASFENTTVSFWNGATFVSDAGKHGSQVGAMAGTGLGNSLAIPVEPGRTYRYSFWHKAGGSWARIEWGLTDPALGGFWGQASGNTSVGCGASWTEATGSFTPASGQTTFYINGRGNPGPAWVDSVYVAVVIPPPSGTALAVK